MQMNGANMIMHTSKKQNVGNNNHPLTTLGLDSFICLKKHLMHMLNHTTTCVVRSWSQPYFRKCV